ncbi:MAG: hypothetical protein AMJ79_08245 [Phycisphaerae bacterium SM23_30]|nr:MAG: hypothetical protein AMJ79_08245 [Phycisphaerae bacterium SM23_30]
MKKLFNQKIDNCKTIRNWIIKTLNARLSIQADWMQAHIINCPRCRQRLSGFNRVALGLSLMKSQAHNRDLLKRANQQAINVLQKSLRQLPQAEKLRRKQPKPQLCKRLGKYSPSLSNAAACLMLLLLIRIGVFSGMEKCQTAGEKAVRQHYVLHLGEELTDDLFMT